MRIKRTTPTSGARETHPADRRGVRPGRRRGAHGPGRRRRTPPSDTFSASELAAAATPCSAPMWRAPPGTSTSKTNKLVVTVDSTVSRRRDSARSRRRPAPTPAPSRSSAPRASSSKLIPGGDAIYAEQLALLRRLQRPQRQHVLLPDRRSLHRRRGHLVLQLRPHHGDRPHRRVQLPRQRLRPRALQHLARPATRAPRAAPTSPAPANATVGHVRHPARQHHRHAQRQRHRPERHRQLRRRRHRLRHDPDQRLRRARRQRRPALLRQHGASA